MFLTLVATLGGLLFGYDTAVISGTVKYLEINFVDPLGWMRQQPARCWVLPCRVP